MNDVLIVNIGCIAGISTGESRLLKGSQMSVLNSIENAWLLIRDGKIYSWGAMESKPDSSADIIDANGGHLLPAWCDSHTHIVFAGSREQEFVMRMKGKSYEEIAEAGGGILNSAAVLQNTAEEILYEAAAKRLTEVMHMGTGAIEIKSGYGLTTESEIKMLRVIRKLKENFPLHIKSSFLGAHAIPTIFKHNREAYIQKITDEMLPLIAGEGLADYIDVFCDKGFYTVEETDRILKAGQKYGLKAKIHANELANSGGVQVGIANEAISVDHLEAIDDKEIQDLLQADTIPTVLPSVSFFLGIPYAPARRMIDAGLGIAIASDYNPGSSPSGNIPLLMGIACHNMKITPEEAFNATTINGACALELQHELGSIAVGKWANLIITKPIPTLAFIPYKFGSNHISKVLIKGQVV
jgi:imidazolonepropionase